MLLNKSHLESLVLPPFLQYLKDNSTDRAKQSLDYIIGNIDFHIGKYFIFTEPSPIESYPEYIQKEYELFKKKRYSE